MPTSMSLDGIRILKESTVPSLEDLGTKLATLNLTLEPGEGRGDVGGGFPHQPGPLKSSPQYYKWE